MASELADTGVAMILEGNEPGGLAALDAAGHALVAARGAWR